MQCFLPKKTGMQSNETLFLVSIPGMRESIREGMESSLEDCDRELDW